MSFCHMYVLFYPSLKRTKGEQQTQPVQQPLVTQDDILGNMNVDYDENKAASVKCPL